MECQPEEEIGGRGKERGSQEPFQEEEMLCWQSLGPRVSRTSPGPGAHIGTQNASALFTLMFIPDCYPNS